MDNIDGLDRELCNLGHMRQMINHVFMKLLKMLMTLILLMLEVILKHIISLVKIKKFKLWNIPKDIELPITIFIVLDVMSHILQEVIYRLNKLLKVKLKLEWVENLCLFQFLFYLPFLECYYHLIYINLYLFLYSKI